MNNIQREQKQFYLQQKPISFDNVSQNYQSIYNREDFTLTEVIDMEKQIQKLKILFEFFDVWEAGLVYREQKEEELHEKIRQSEQVSLQLDEDQINFRQSTKSSQRQKSFKINENDIEELKHKQQLITDREKQLGNFEQDLTALRQEINKKNITLEKEFQELERIKKKIHESKSNNNYQNPQEEFRKSRYLQKEYEECLKQESEIESKFASLNEKEIQTDENEKEIQRQYKEIEESRNQIDEKKSELISIQEDMLAKQKSLQYDLQNAQKKLEIVSIQVNCVQNQQSSQFYKEKLETRDKQIAEYEKKLSTREEQLLKDILKLKKWCQMKQISLSYIKQSQQLNNNTSRRCKTEVGASEVYQNNSLKVPTNQSLVQTPPHNRNLSTEQNLIQNQYEELMASDIISLNNQTQRENIKTDRENSQNKRDMSPVQELKLKLSSRKKELSEFLSPVHQQVRKFDVDFIGVINQDEENMKKKVLIHQSYQNGYEMYHANMPQNQTQQNSRNSIQQNSQQNSVHQNSIQQSIKLSSDSLSPVKNNKLNQNMDNIIEMNQTQCRNNRSGSVQSMSDKILQQMKLNQKFLSSSKKSMKQNSSIPQKVVSQSDMKNSNKINNIVSRIIVPSQIKFDECKQKVNQMTNSQKIKNKILKFTPEQTEMYTSPKKSNNHNQDDKQNQFSFRKSDYININQNENQNSKMILQPNNQHSLHHQRTFSFANIGSSQETNVDTQLSSQLQSSNLFNFRNSSAYNQFQKNKLTSCSKESEVKRYQQVDENFDPKKHNSNQKTKNPQFVTEITLSQR